MQVSGQGTVGMVDLPILPACVDLPSETRFSTFVEALNAQLSAATRHVVGGKALIGLACSWR